MEIKPRGYMHDMTIISAIQMVLSREDKGGEGTKTHGTREGVGKANVLGGMCTKLDNMGL